MVRRNVELQIYHCRVDGAPLVLAIQEGIEHAQLNNLFAANPLEGRDSAASSQITMPVPLAILAGARPDLVRQEDLEGFQRSLEGSTAGLRSDGSQTEAVLEPQAGGSFIDLT